MSSDFGRSNQIETTLFHQPKQAVFLRISLGHDFFIGKALLRLAERAKSRGTHGGAPETGFNPMPYILNVGRRARQWCNDAAARDGVGSWCRSTAD